MIDELEESHRALARARPLKWELARSTVYAKAADNSVDCQPTPTDSRCFDLPVHLIAREGEPLRRDTLPPPDET